jgi:hypothetical protein
MGLKPNFFPLNFTRTNLNLIKSKKDLFIQVIIFQV